MKILRTPDSCFEDLPGFPFEPRYTGIDAGDGTMLRMHHVEEGPSEAAATIVGTFAWAGATQIVHGMAMLAVSLWYRSLVPLPDFEGQRRMMG